MRRIRVKELIGRDTLVGKIAAQKDAPLFFGVAFSDERDETLMWDWSGIEIATASYFAATIVPLLTVVVSGKVEKYFVFTGFNGNCLDELKLVLDKEKLVVMLAELKGDSIRSVELVGDIDQVYSDTFNEVMRRKTTSATELFKSLHKKGKVNIGKTGWVNRLTGLSRLRLLRREKVGKEFVFRPSFVEVH